MSPLWYGCGHDYFAEIGKHYNEKHMEGFLSWKGCASFSFQSTSTNRASECYAALERKAALYDKLGELLFNVSWWGKPACCEKVLIELCYFVLTWKSDFMTWLSGLTLYHTVSAWGKWTILKQLSSVPWSSES